MSSHRRAGSRPRRLSALVGYVFAKPPGEVHQEIGSVMVTLFALGHAKELRVLGCAHTEIERIHSLPAERFQNRQRRNAADGIGSGPEAHVNKGKVAGHALAQGAMGRAQYPFRNGVSQEAVCECGAQSEPLATVAERRAWHRQHKSDKIDSFVANGIDDRGREVHL